MAWYLFNPTIIHNLHINSLGNLDKFITQLTAVTVGVSGATVDSCNSGC